MFGQRLKFKRRELGYTQEELGKMAGVTARALQSYEQGHRLPPVDIAYRIAVAIEMSLDELMKPDEPQPAVRVEDGKIKAKTYATLLDDTLFDDMLGRNQKRSDRLSIVVQHYWELDDTGQEKIKEYTLDLSSSEKYKRNQK